MVLVVGATGMLGGLVVRRLLAEGREVRALVRDSLAVAALGELGARPVIGDLKDASSLDAALDGVDAVITTANSARRGGADTIETVDRAGNRALIDAARRTGVRRFVFVSALGASVDSPVPFLRAKGETEAHLRASGLEYCIIAPNVFMDVWVPAVVGGNARAGRPVVLVGEGRRRHSFIAIRDVAAFTAAVLDHPAALNATLPIGGPEPVSWRDVIAAYEEALGVTIPVRSVSPGDPALGLPEPMPSLLAAFETFDSPLEMRELAQTFGVSLTSMREFVREDVTATPRVGEAPSHA